MNLEQRRQADQVIHGGQGSAVLPLVDCLGRVEAKRQLQIVDGQSGSLSQPYDVYAGLNRVDCGKEDHRLSPPFL